MKNFSGNGTITYDNGDVYEGAVRSNEPEGLGKMTYKDGRVCEGIWEEGEIYYEGELDDNGEPHGRGKMMHLDGTYEGEFQHGLIISNKGTYKWSDGSSYKGEWKNNEMHGKGIQKWSDGSVQYDGEWKDNLWHGKGTYKWPDGTVEYDGEWKDNEYHGKGTCYTCNYFDGVYTGDWHAGKRQGRGVMTYSNGDIYDGQWKKDYEDGQGTMKFINGDLYEGHFSKGKLHGKGTYSYAAGDILKCIGEWKKGKKCGEFENIVRFSKNVYYGNDEVKADTNVGVKREAQLDEDTDFEGGDGPPSKRRNVCMSPPQV